MYHRRAQIAIRIRVLDHDQHDQRLEEEEEAITSRNIIAVDNSSSSSSTEDEDVLAIIINSRRAVTIKRLPKCQLHRAVVAVEKERAKRRRHHRLARLAVLAVVAVVTAATVPLLRLLLLVAVVDANTHRDPVRKQQPGRRAAKRKQTPKEVSRVDRARAERYARCNRCLYSVRFIIRWEQLRLIRCWEEFTVSSDCPDHRLLTWHLEIRRGTVNRARFTERDCIITANQCPYRLIRLIRLRSTAVWRQ